MKAGYVATQLAWHFIAHGRAMNCLLYLMIGLMALSKATASNLGPNDEVVVPFRTLGNSIMVEGTLNGDTGWFMFDIGSPFVILNTAYYGEQSAGWDKTPIKSLHGELMHSQQIWLGEGVIGDLHLPPSHAQLLDLTPIEQIKKFPIKGIIGYEAIRNFEIRFDFKCQDLIFSNGRGNRSQTTPTDSFDFKMSGHVPFLAISIDGKTYKMGIDSGSEYNIFQNSLADMHSFQETGHLHLAGLTHKKIRRPIGIVRNVDLGNLPTDSLEVVLTDLNKVVSALPIRLHGLLGVAFLKQHKMSINYARKKLYVWREREIPMSTPSFLAGSIVFPW